VYKSIKNKTAIITGASAGIGKAIAENLAKSGAKIFLISRDEKKLVSLKKELKMKFSAKVDYLSGDVKDPGLSKLIVKVSRSSFGSCDILINNAGGPPPGSFLEHTEEIWNEYFNQNLLSTIRLSKLVVPEMKKKKWGRIINVTSSLAKEPTPNMVLSATMRAGVSAFTKAISTELADKGITVNTVCPGGVLTDRLINLIKIAAKNNKKTYKQTLKESELSIPIGRFASPEEFANTVTYLASEESRYITGISLMIDGGLTKSIF
tara:strand:- start:314 stop:1105 length:792 start_codon:yes stop_codon:yes gene_type:complete